ncbi:DUF5337 domain-containing protein [Amylibacter sp. IMCC11727]|uniref:DUF5337 domain-containing protein n=1 Tax=Amylibacter sp. IMCC11727 TaxID=3039851 RepID=UPI00244DD498|nr:DUF5337 domain-containing protein [Amylibacter sp. IMCC11727]WGI23395.1 DUF5337 domain-containing protein [Amylibacter sp. IMCC11727]
MAPKHPDPAPDLASRQIRIASIVIIVTMVVWMGASFIGGQIGLPTRYAFLIDLAALAAFFWALVNLYQAWRKRQTMKD